MKRTLFSLLYSFLSICLLAQERILTVDNQTPGWLSSKLTYAQQVTVEELKVTGYVNKTDVDFLNTLAKTRVLKVLDLSETSVTRSDGIDNIIWNNCITAPFQKLTLPHSLKGTVYSSDKIITSIIDTLIIGFDLKEFGDNTITQKPPKRLIIKEGVKTIPRNCFNFSATSTNDVNDNKLIKCYIDKLPNSIETIEANAFVCCHIENIPSLPNKAKRLGNLSEDYPDQGFGTWYFQYYTPYYADSIIMPISKEKFQFPDSLEIYCSGALKYTKHWTTGGSDDYYDPTHIYKSDTIIVGEKCDTLIACIQCNIAIFKSQIPPKYNKWNMPTSPYIPRTSYYFPYEITDPFKIKTLFVPKGCLEAYKKEYENLTNIEEIKEMLPITSISLSIDSTKMLVGESINIKAEIFPFDAYNKTLIWTSSNKNVVQVNNNGTVTALSSGKAIIKASSSESSAVDSCEIIVGQRTESIILDTEELLLTKIGEKKLLIATITPEDALDKSIIWRSSNSSICEVTQDGLVIATGEGTCVIFATSADGEHFAICTVTVSNVKVTSIELSYKEKELLIGESFQLEATVLPNNALNKEVTWMSNDLTIATVDDKGMVTAIASGEVTITAKAKETNVKDECKIIVGSPIKGITLNKSEISITSLDATEQLIATILPEDALNKEVTWRSSNPNVCEVTQDGIITAKSDGSSIILVTTSNGEFFATCIVTVNTIPTSIGQISENYTLTIKDLMNINYIKVYSLDGKLIYQGKGNRISKLKGLFFIDFNGKKVKIIL